MCLFPAQRWSPEQIALTLAAFYPKGHMPFSSEVSKPLGLTHIHARVLGAPLIKRDVTEAVFTPDLLPESVTSTSMLRKCSCY